MHFTYVAAAGDLQQGDILARTSALDALIESVHPYYHSKSDYVNFVVLTQSCDLVRRSSSAMCAAQYISICAVRPLSVVLEREAKKYQLDDKLRLLDAISSRNRSAVRAYVERILNNNLHEYFYLHEDPELGITDRLCAFLRLSISVRAAEHYSTLLDARVAALSPSFQAKLGWLVGDIYSRVGTDDWADMRSSAEWNALVTQVLDDTILWVDDEKLRHYVRANEQAFDSKSASEIIEEIKSTKVPAKKDQAIEIVTEKLLALVAVEPDLEKKLRIALRNDPQFAALFK